MKRNQVTFVAGRKGSGKTYWAKGQVDEYRGPVLIFDTAHDFAGEGVDRPIRHPLIFRSCADAKASARAGKLGDAPRIVLQTPRGDRGRAEFDAACRWALRAGDLLLVVDEVDQYCSPSAMREPLSDAISLGRHARLDLIFLARRPAEVHREITSQADKIVAFQTTEPRDLEYLERLTGSTFAKRLRSLGKFGSAEHSF